MSKKSNDSIEEFFKKGVRKSDITFRESDWQKMERMLDEKAMVGSASTSRPWKRVIGVVLILALMSSLYFLISENISVSPVDQNQVVENQKQDSPLATSPDKSSAATASTQTQLHEASDRERFTNP